MPESGKSIQEVLQAALDAHRAGDHGRARLGYEEHLKSVPANARAWYFYGRLLSELGEMAAAQRALEQSLRIDPAQAQVWRDLSSLLIAQAQFEKASIALRKTLQLDASQRDLWAALGSVYAALGQHANAVPCFEQALASGESGAEFLSGYANSLWAVGNLARAEQLARSACDKDPRLPAARNNLGNVLRSSNRLAEARESYARAIELDPEFHAARKNLGLLLLDLEAYKDAEAQFRKIESVDESDAVVLTGLAVCAEQRGDLATATAYFRAALARAPDDVVILCKFAGMWISSGQPQQAMALLKPHIERHPGDSDALLALAAAHLAKGEPDSAARLTRQSLMLRETAPAWNNLGMLQLSQGLAEAAKTSLRNAVRLDPSARWMHSNLLFVLQHAPSTTVEELVQVQHDYAALGSNAAAPMVRPPHVSKRTDRRITIGYVSSDFREHPVARFMLPLLRSVDRDEFRIAAFSGGLRNDAVTETLKSLVDVWVPTAGLSDEQLADAVRTSQVDVLIDLAGHSSGNRLGAFSLGPAPLQMTYLGYPGSTATANVHYRITDDLIDPPGSAALYSERLLALECLSVSYEPADYILDAQLNAMLPCERTGHFTFASFNSLSKINSRTIDVWSRILHRVPGSRLMMVTVPEGESRERIISQFSEHGIDGNRLELLPSQSHRAFIDLMQTADVALDAFPVNGNTTTFECLWMGLPVISLAGDRTASRYGLSILTRLGMPEWVARSEEEYVLKAGELAGSTGKIHDFRRGIRHALINRPGANLSALTAEFHSRIRKAFEMIAN